MSDVAPAIDPVPVLLEPGDRSPFDKSVAAGLVGLVYLARQAFEERRRKQCLEIIDAILKIEPEHAEARTIQASVRSDLEQDFANAQAVVKEAQAKSDPALYKQAATALRRIVDADPDNLEAQTLLHDTVAAGYSCLSSQTGRSGWTPRRRLILVGSVAFVILVAALTLTNGTGSQITQLATGPGVLASSKPPGNTNSEITLDDGPTLSLPTSPDLHPGPHRLSFNGDEELTEPVVGTVIADNRQTASISLKPVRSDTVPAPLKAGDSGPILRTEPAPSSRPSALPSSTGNLAVSAAVPVEIYRGGEYLGSTPTTLQLPQGSQTLEYRYQGLRQTLTHFITGQETTTATISFLMRVQINARPWAQVFIDGVKLTPIGQTPLGDVTVPIGSVLVFQNPGFPDKRYRVTAKDAAIQVTFP